MSTHSHSDVTGPGVVKPARAVALDVRTPEHDAEAARARPGAAFAEAPERDSPGVFLMIHANPGLERRGAERRGFEAFLEALEGHVEAFGRPVLLAHGDSHSFRVDMPALVDRGFLRNFTRVETFGASRVHWLRIGVDPASREVFTVHPEIVTGNP